MKIKGQATSLIGVFIGIMVVTIIAVSVVLPVIQDRITEGTTLGSNEELGINSENGTTTQLAYGNLVIDSDVIVIADSGATLTKDTNYTITQGTPSIRSIVSWIDVNATAVLANATYSYYPSGYIHSQVVITLLNLLPLFIVLAVIIMVVGLIKF